MYFMAFHLACLVRQFQREPSRWVLPWSGFALGPCVQAATLTLHQWGAWLHLARVALARFELAGLLGG